MATIPEAYAKQVLEREANQVLALPLEEITLETYMYWAANANSDPANRWLREQVRSALRTRTLERERHPHELGLVGVGAGLET